MCSLKKKKYENTVYIVFKKRFFKKNPKQFFNYLG